MALFTWGKMKIVYDYARSEIFMPWHQVKILIKGNDKG